LRGAAIKGLGYDKNYVLLREWLKVLVAEWWVVGNLHNIKFKVDRPMTAVASVRQENVTVPEHCGVFLPNGHINAVQGSFEHTDLFAFFSFGLISFNCFNCFFDFVHLKIRKLPIVVLSCEPELVVMNLDAAHEFSESRFVSVRKFAFQAVDTLLQWLSVVGPLIAVKKYQRQYY